MLCCDEKGWCCIVVRSVTTRNEFPHSFNQLHSSSTPNKQEEELHTTHPILHTPHPILPPLHLIPLPHTHLSIPISTHLILKSTLHATLQKYPPFPQIVKTTHLSIAFLKGRLHLYNLINSSWKPRWETELRNSTLSLTQNEGGFHKCNTHAI